MNWWCSCGACEPMPTAERLVSEKRSSHLPRLLSLQYVPPNLMYLQDSCKFGIVSMTVPIRNHIV